MAFNHAQPRKDDSSGNCEPLSELSQGKTHSSDDSSSTADSGEHRASMMGAYDEETRFELLSAYVDNEVTSEERQLVGQWLRDEPDIQRMYQQLLMLRQAIRTAPNPSQTPLEVPIPPNWWARASSATLRWTLVCTAAISLLGGITHLSTVNGRQSIQEAWQFIQNLPQRTLFEFASTAAELPTERTHKSPTH
ncbi:MAG: hypothetical protein AAF959_18830 [Cyanobacteria bacterium P01_D01_bin.56]